jgi:hypothetical protein
MPKRYPVLPKTELRNPDERTRGKDPSMSGLPPVSG